MSTDGAPVPVSGEIIPRDVAACHGRRTGGADILDAEYETVSDTPQRKDRAFAPTPAAAAPTGLDILQRGAGAARGRGDRAGAVTWAAGLLAAAAAFWLSGGHALFDRAGAAAPAMAGDTLHIMGLESRLEPMNQGFILTVEGDARNSGGESRQLPDLSINVLDMNGHTAHYFLGTNRRSLAPGDRFSFSSRLVAPKAGVKSVSVSFVE